MLSFDELQKKYKDQKPQTVAGPSTEDPLYIKYREAVEAEKPKVAGGTVNPIISFGNVRENPVLKRKTNTTKTYSQALTESRNKAKVLENGAKLPAVIPPKGDVSKLILPDTGGGGTVNPTLKRNEVRTNYDYMTDREAAVYKYYRDRGQVEKAQEYLDALEMDVNQRAAMQKQEDAKKLAEESTAAALYARAVGNIGQAAGAVYAAAMEGADKPVDPYHPLMGGVNMNEGLAEGLMGDSAGAEKFAKEAGLAVFDWGTQAATLGPLTPYVMAAGAAAGNTKEALERGGTTDEAVMYGLAGGAAEAITEKLGYDRLFELGKITKNKGVVSTFLKSLLPQAASEGAEEATSEIANILADTLIMGDNSQMKQIAQTAMENGATESEAVKTALMEGIKQVGYSGAVGAASGGVIAGGIGGLSRMTGRNTLEMAGNPVETARDAMTNAGNEVTQRTMKSRTRSEVPEGTQPETMLKEQGNVLPERENMLPEQENVMVNRENVPEVTQQNKALREFGEKYYYTEGQKVVNEEAERRGDTSFIPAFQTYYTAGLTGVKESDIKQTAETIVADKGLLRAAYLAGVNDRKEDLEARMKGTGKMGQTAGVFLETDAVTEDQLSFIKAVSKVAELEAVLVEELPEDRRGYYENNKGRITIAVNSGQFAGTVFHELSHYIREANPEGFDRMRQAVFSAAAAMKGMDTEAYIKSYEKRYGEAYREAGQEAGYDVILEEMTADMLGELAGDEKSLRAFLEELNRENPTVLGKIREFVESLLKTLKGLVNDGRFSSFSEELKKDIDFTERLAKMLAEETKKAGEMQRGENAGKGKGKDTEKKLSKKIGGVFPEINVSVEDFKQMGISEKSLNNLKVIEEKVYQYLSGKFLSEGNREKPILNLDTGMEVCVYRGGINETFRKDAYYKNLSSEWKKIKLAAMMHMDMLIKYGEIREKEAANYHNENSTTRFAYLTAPILVGGKPYTVDIDIKRTDRGDRFHVHKIKIADSSAQAAKMRPVFEVELSAEQIIAQDNREDNGKGGESGKMFSFAGERARTADREKLDMAKKMEEEGKTRREIYDETGWFRGADDKWRFEIDDSQMQYRYAGVPGISAYLQNTELFEAYPELRDVTIKFEKLKNGVRGIYNKEENEITLDESLKEEPGTVLLHEIQHAIQRIEGHASGANREYWERRIEEGFDARTAEEKAKEWNLTKQMEKLKRKNQEFYQEMQELDSMVPTVPRGRIDWESLEQIEPDPIEWQLYDQRKEQIEEKYGEEMVWEYIDLKYELDQSRKESGRTAFDLYYATAGEIEARDAEKRMNFAKEDRKRWFPNIGDEDTVFAEGMRFSLKEPIEETKDLIAVHNLTGEKLRKLLDLPGIPMPSIAITKSDATAEDFGEISLVFRKDTIDPADERNKVFDADAWTPMFPMLDKEEYGKTRAFLEELVRTMQAQTKSGKNAQGFMGENTMRAAMANRFVSLGEIKEAREKLEHLPKKEFEALREEMNQRLFGVLEEIYDTGSQTGINEVYEMEDIGEQIQNMAEEAKGVPSARQIQQNLRKAGYPISMELAEQTARVLEEIKEMPTDFFEAKPERVVEFAEVAAAVVPDDLEVDLQKEVENKIPQVLEYEAGSKESRVQQLNRVQGVRFSIRETEDGKKVAVVDNDVLSHVDTENWNKTEKEKARKAAVESLLRFQNGIVVDHLKYHVNKQSRDEYTRSNDAERLYRVDKKAYGDKMRLAAYIDDAIVAATNWKADENLKHDRKDKIVQFLHGETLIQSGDNQYVAKVIVGITTAGRYLFYDVEDLKRTKFKLKEESSTAVVGNDTVNAIQEDSSDQSVAQGKREVKDVSQTNDMDIYFSIREEEYDALVEENEALKEANEALRRQFEITKDAVHDPVSAKKAVRKWLKAHDSEYDVDDFTEKFVALADYVANSGDRVDFQKVMGALQKLAYDALSESKVLNTDLSDAYKDFKNDVRKTKIKVTDSMLEELEYYGGYIEFRKRNFGKLNLSRQSGIPADVFYQEMAEKYPGLLKEGNVKTQVDILIDLANTVDSLQPIYENPYGMNLDEYAMDAAYDLWEMYFDIEMQKPTFADKYEKKVEQIQIENQKLKAAKNKMRQEMKERHEEQMEKAKAEANKKLEEEREKYIRQVDVLLEEKYKLRQKLETQWKAHKNSMVEAQRTELARLIAEGKKTAAEIRELKKDKKELKQRMDEVLEKEDLWVQACQAILRENNKEINRYKKQVQRLKESKEKQRERAIRKYDRLLEAKFQLQDRQKKQSERRKYAKYRRVVEQETNKMLKWITKPTDTYHVPEEMTKGLKELLTKIGTSDGEIMIMQNDLFQAIKDLERFRPKDGKEEADFFVEHDEQTIDSMNEFIRKYPNGFDLENLPADEMKELADILRSIHKRITNANKFISLFRQVEVREVSEKFLSESQKMKNTVQEGRTRQVLDFFNMDLVDPYSFFSGMGDSVRNTLFKATEEGFERKIRHEAEAEKFISGIVSKKEAAAWSTAAPTLYKIGGRDIYMTPAEVMSLYATYRRNQGILHLLEGGFKTAFNKLKRMTRDEADTRLKNFNPYQPSRKEMEDIFETLTDKQKEVVEKAQDFLSNVVGGWGNETSMEMFGYKKFNDQRYFPISSDQDYINNVFGDPNQKQKALVNIAAARPTSDQAKNPIVIEDFFTVFARHIDQMSSYNAFVPVISDWNKFMGYKKYSREAGVQEVESVKKEISRTMGKGAISYIRKFLEDIQSVNTGEKAPITKTLVSNMKRASVGANLRVAIQQPVSIVRAADMLSPKYLMMAFAKGKNDFEKIYEYAPIAQWKEWGHYDMNIARGLEERIRGQSILGKISDYSMVMASWGDKFTWGRIWKAVEMETRDKYPDLKGERFDRNVGERFSEIINRTQVVDSMLHRSQIMREKTIYKQMTTSFMGEPIKTYNMMRSHIVELMKDNTKENRNKVVRSFVTLTFNAVAVAAAAAVVDALRDDDDDETWAEKWLEAFRGDYEKAESGGEKVMAFLSSNVGQNTNPFTYIPYLKDVVSLLQGYTVQRTDIGWVSDIIKSGNVLMQYIKGESPYTFTAVLANTAASLSKATGLPIASAKRDMEAIKNTVINQAMGLETQYGNKKLTYALGSEKNVSMYVKMMIDAKLSGNDKLATRIYNEMVNAGISNEKMESQLGSKEKEKIKKDSAAMEAVEAYAKKDYDTYTQKLDELRKKYSQKNIESTIRSMYEDKYGKEDIETFDKITQDFWEKEEEVESSQFKTVIDAMMEAKLSGKLGEATKLYNYMVNNGLPNDKLDSAIDSREKELLKNDPLTKEGAEAFHEGDADRYVDIVEQLKNKNYYARNVTSAIESMHDKLYGEDDEDTFETITQDFWEEDEADEMVSYELLFNAFWNGSRGTYNEVWGLLNAAGKEDKSIRASMRNRCYDAYWKAEGEGNTEEMNKAAAEYQRNGGKLETLLKPPKE